MTKTVCDFCQKDVFDKGYKIILCPAQELVNGIGTKCFDLCESCFHKFNMIKDSWDFIEYKIENNEKESLSFKDKSTTLFRHIEP